MTIQDASAIVGRNQGLPASFDGSTAAINALDTDQKLALTGGVMAYIRDFPDQFTPQQVATARSRQNTDYTNGLADDSFSITDFATETLKNGNDLILEPLASVGRGVSSSVNAIGKLLPLVVITAGLFLAYAWTRRAAPPSPTPIPA